MVYTGAYCGNNVVTVVITAGTWDYSIGGTVDLAVVLRSCRTLAEFWRGAVFAQCGIPGRMCACFFFGVKEACAHVIVKNDGLVIIGDSRN